MPTSSDISMVPKANAPFRTRQIRGPRHDGWHIDANGHPVNHPKQSSRRLGLATLNPNIPTASSAPPMSMSGTRPRRSEARPAISRIEMLAMTMMVLKEPL